MSDTHKYSFKVLLLLADLAAFGGALLGGMWLRYYHHLWVFEAAPAPWAEVLQVLPYALVIYAVVLRFSGLYHLHRSALDEVLGLLRAIIVSFAIILAVTFFYRTFSYSRAVVLLMLPLTFVGTLLLRTLVRFFWHQVLQLDPVQGSALLVGSGPVAEHLVEQYRGRRQDFVVQGVVQVDAEEPIEAIKGVPVVGALEDLDALLASGTYQVVLVADARLDREQHLEIAEHCLRHTVQYHVVPDIFELMLDRLQVNTVGGLPLMGLKASNLTGTNALIKRVFDLVAVSVLLAAATPVMLITAIVIKLSSKGPIFFVQERVGLNGRTFKLLKFRSMHVASDDHVREYAQQWITKGAANAESDDGEEKVFKVKNDPRIFRFGAFIRKYSIDELPQFINVLRGDMSLIGPRPPVPYEVEVYRDWHRRRFEAHPGITGLWQVSGRNHLSFDQMVKLDIEYIENWSLGLDLKIVLKTVRVVVAGSGY
ncbi:MAG: sugar transferase [Deltaproteobacteria bacterium]|nr:sugar transferase [Deltaproteobacteria bacterium]